MTSKREPWEGFVADRIRPLTTVERGRIEGKRVLITGAGGFLGSGLVRALAELRVGSLILLDSAEYGLYCLEQELGAPWKSSPKAVYAVGSVSDRGLVRALLAENRPELVVHAAALKHVPLMEANAIAAAETNALGTEVMVSAAREFGVERFVLLSTDKAVEPVGVMGATKRIAETITVAANSDSSARTRCTVVRLCNVLGSTGSVAPLFARQIEDGGPITMTDPGATRYFLSLGDAVRSLLHAIVYGGEAALLIPPSGPALRVEQLAAYLNDADRSGRPAVRVQVTGLRAGERLHERLLSEAESVRMCRGSGDLLEVDTAVSARLEVESLIEQIRDAVRTRREDLLRAAIARALEGEAAAGERTGEVCR